MTAPYTSPTAPPKAAEPLNIDFSEDLLSRLTSHFDEFGDAFRAYSPATKRDIYVFSHPDHVKHVLVTHQQNYTKGIGIERVGILLGNGIMVSEDTLWRRQRKMIQPAFHGSVIAHMTTHIRRINLQLREKWLASAALNEDINLTQDMSDITLKIVLRAIFSDDLDDMVGIDGSNPFALLTDDSERNLAFAYRFRSLAKLIMRCVEQRRNAQQQPEHDLLSMLMRARDRKSGEAMPDRQLLDEVMTLIVAGHETTASALNWMWYLLSQHPSAEMRLHQEIDALPDDNFDIADLEHLPWTRQIIDETLRLYPPGWLLTRRTIGPDKVGDYPLAAGSDIFIVPYIIHRHPQFWPAPERFDPERFSPEQQVRRHRFAYLPFALGPRACIGEHFAMVEMMMHAALVARRVHLSYLPQQPIELECQVNLRTKYNLMMKPEQRCT